MLKDGKKASEERNRGIYVCLPHSPRGPHRADRTNKERTQNGQQARSRFDKRLPTMNRNVAAWGGEATYRRRRVFMDWSVLSPSCFVAASPINTKCPKNTFFEVPQREHTPSFTSSVEQMCALRWSLVVHYIKKYRYPRSDYAPSHPLLRGELFHIFFSTQIYTERC